MVVNFYLKSQPDKQNFHRIYLYFRYNAKELQFYTGEKILKKQWNKKQFVNSGVNDAAKINDRLKFIKEKILEIYRFYQNKGIIPNNEILRDELNKVVNKEVIKEKSFYEYFSDFLEIQKPPQKSKLTYGKFKNVLNHLQNFEKQYNYKINYLSLNDVFFSKFYTYFIEVLNNNDNTFYKYLKSINQFVKWSYEKEYLTSNRPYYFKIKEKKQIVFFLDSDEFLTLYNSRIENKRLENVRDLFCFGCVTAIRFSAMQRLTTNNIQKINGKEVIFYVADKSKKPTIVPLTEYAKNIIEKHKGNQYLLPQISNKNANLYIKEIFEILGLSRIITQMQFKGSETKEIHYKLNEKLSFKISKKTCVTLLHGLGVQPEIIGLFTANTPETLKHYLGTDKTKANQQFLDVFDSLEK